MKVFKNLSEISNIESCAIALGNFDGVHKGHQMLIKTAVNVAKEKGIKSAVFTFTNHPLNEMSGRIMVKTILNFDEKAEILDDIGVDYLFSIPFNEEVRTLSPEDFIEKLLIGTMKMKHAVCGFNYSYGFKAAGKPSDLQAAGQRLGYGVDVIDPVIVNGLTVSSTLIRACLERGAVDEYKVFTGRPYIIDGVVMQGEKNGRKMGFPTVNLNLTEEMALPANGVYVTRTHLNGRVLNSITNVGNKPTIGQFAKNAETHIFDFQEDVYGQPLRVEFLHMLREERTFANMDELSAEIDRNCMEAKAYHSQHK